MKIINIIIILFLITFFAPVIASSGETEDEEEFLSQFFWREVITLPKEKRPKVCVVLGGGGARGLSHIGVLRVLEEEGFPIDAIAGTSVGSLVGALYCSSVNIEEMENLSKEVGWSDLTNYSLRSLVSLILAGNLLSTKKMEDYISKYIGNREFHQLNIPFACVATDLKTGEKIVFSEGNVAKAVRASSTIPGVFYPVEYRHRLLVDGGLVDNIPTDLGKMLGADIIIAVDISSDFTKYATSNILLVLNQAIYIQGGMRASEELKYADIIINPHVSEVAAYELWRAEECIEAGIIATRKMMPKLKQLLMERTFKKILESK